MKNDKWQLVAGPLTSISYLSFFIGHWSFVI